ncbi:MULTISPECIES: DinB family protein [Bacillus cereus group]|uniref:DinB family protein n=2 Tax=Bacillus cereus group TaxID=86661 RepID=A0A2C1CLZ8_BACCE|nr:MULTISPECIES: DinB family protein [Bacillus cereus group]OFD76087.1 PadR family transcriptional regulator [Bacillus mycoides]OFD79279.1 PadR family transcriptional regulator [Bacillus mycoides]OFD81779.1 PadR family transcriptional regulator [Bacillus mycoides]PGS89192.1 DinB family protein [Bacillus cereus]
MNKFVNDKFYETRNNLLEEITLLSNAQFNSKPDMNKWSIAQVCHHLVLLDERAIKVISFGLKEIDSLQIERQEIHSILLDRTKKFIAPEILEPSLEPFEVQQMIDLLNDSRKKLMTFLSTVEDVSILTKKSVKHPALGELLLDQWVELIYLHEQRHIEQIKEVQLLL